jgi:hypothetical protein
MLAKNRRLLAQLSYVALFDADAIEDAYAWPPKTLTADELDEIEHLRRISDTWHERAKAAGFNGGTDAAFDPAFAFRESAAAQFARSAVPR